MTFVANYDVCCQLWRLFLRGFITVLYPVSLYFIYNYRLPVREVPVEKTSSSEAPNQVKLEISANPARNPTGKKVFCCSSCNKSFQKSGNLKRHLRKHYNCTICNKSFCLSVLLNNHLYSHKRDQSHSCSFCSKIFSQADHLERHLRTHTGEKPFTCSLCNKTFSRAENLKNHTRSTLGYIKYGFEFG